jgi:hypothetical protein
MNGGPITVIESVAVFPVPVFAENTLLVVFVFGPGEVAVTSTLAEQEVFAAIVPPDSDTSEPFAAGAKVAPQVFEALGVAATTNPDGNASMTDSPVTANAFGLVNVSVIPTVPFTGTLSAANDFVTDGGGATRRLADPVFPVPPLVDVTALVTFGFGP